MCFHVGKSIIRVRKLHYHSMVISWVYIITLEEHAYTHIEHIACREYNNLWNILLSIPSLVVRKHI